MFDDLHPPPVAAAAAVDDDDDSGGGVVAAAVAGMDLECSMRNGLLLGCRRCRCCCWRCNSILLVAPATAAAGVAVDVDPRSVRGDDGAEAAIVAVVVVARVVGSCCRCRCC
jgi:hypothetical protein